jgi:ryanodine receptor 2
MRAEGSRNEADWPTYDPRPIDVDSVELPPELAELVELLAENAHEVWSVTRITDGWRYGPKRDDDNKRHPSLIPYGELSDSEKRVDREMASGVLKSVYKLGFEIARVRATYAGIPSQGEFSSDGSNDGALM